MAIEKSTFVSTQANGRLAFRKSGDDLQIDMIDADNTTRDTATLSEDDLRSLLKDNFKGTRGPKKTKPAANGSARKRAGEGASPQA